MVQHTDYTHNHVRLWHHSIIEWAKAKAVIRLRLGPEADPSRDCCMIAVG